MYDSAPPQFYFFALYICVVFNLCLFQSIRNDLKATRTIRIPGLLIIFNMNPDQKRPLRWV